MVAEHSTCFKGGTGESAANKNCDITGEHTETRETLLKGSTRTAWRTGSPYETRKIVGYSEDRGKCF
jgi:hypothetical protein